MTTSSIDGSPNPVRLADVLELLPSEAKLWIEGLTPRQKYGVQVHLDSVGLDGFVEHWSEYKAELIAFEFSYGRL